MSKMEIDMYHDRNETLPANKKKKKKKKKKNETKVNVKITPSLTLTLSLYVVYKSLDIVLSKLFLTRIGPLKKRSASKFKSHSVCP